MDIDKSIKYASQNKEFWSAGGGYYHGWSCDSEFYKNNEKDIEKFTRQYGFKFKDSQNSNGKPIKIKGSNNYYTPMTWVKQ